MTTLNEQRNYEDTLSAKFDLVYFLGCIAWRLLKIAATRAKPGYSYNQGGFSAEFIQLRYQAMLLGRATAYNPLFDTPILSLLSRGVNRLGIQVDPDNWSEFFNEAVADYHFDQYYAWLHDGGNQWPTS
ncbi:hypothetical protein CYD30_20885 [Kosakonia cowanii]|nr:hypothetical protein CYD30_20885 [Kosakonia cowanii]